MNDLSNMPDTQVGKPGVPLIRSGALQLQLIERHAETADITSYRFSVSREDGERFRHHPGQAISLRLTLDGEELVRTFTIASAPDHSASLILTIKAGPDAYGTRYMADKLQPGDRLQARGPFGQFSLVHTPQQPLLLLGAGSGLTPMMSMLRWLAARSEATDVVLLQLARTPADLLFTDELDAIDRAMPGLCHIDAVTEVPPGEAWRGPRGLLSRQSLRALVPDLARRTVFCCGPQGFMDSVQAIYRAEGGDPQRFLTESFGSPSLAIAEVAPPPVALEVTEGASAVQLDQHRFPIAAGQTIVDAAAASGLRIPTACKEGQCGTCRVKLIEGEVDMQQQGGLSAREEQQGYILSCCSTARGDLILSRKG